MATKKKEARKEGRETARAALTDQEADWMNSPAMEKLYGDTRDWQRKKRGYAAKAITRTYGAATDALSPGISAGQAFQTWKMRDTLTPQEVMQLKSQGLAKLADIEAATAKQRAKKDIEALKIAAKVYGTSAGVWSKKNEIYADTRAKMADNEIDAIDQEVARELGGIEWKPTPTATQVAAARAAFVDPIKSGSEIEPSDVEMFLEAIVGTQGGDGVALTAIKQAMAEAGRGDTVEGLLSKLQGGDADAFRALEAKLSEDQDSQAVMAEADRMKTDTLTKAYTDLDKNITGYGDTPFFKTYQKIMAGDYAGAAQLMEGLSVEGAEEGAPEGQARGQARSQVDSDETATDRLGRFLEMIENASIPEHLRAKKALLESPEFKGFMKRLGFKPGAENVALRTLKRMARASAKKARAQGRGVEKEVMRAIQQGGTGLPSDEPERKTDGIEAAVHGAQAEDVVTATAQQVTGKKGPLDIPAVTEAISDLYPYQGTAAKPVPSTPIEEEEEEEPKYFPTWQKL